jgi:ribosomal protein L11 methyltransferase
MGREIPPQDRTVPPAPKRNGKTIREKPEGPGIPFLNDRIFLDTDLRVSVCTGTHPTTSLCMTMIEKYLKKGNKVLDVGTGNGILMIAAAKLGAGRVFGIDSNSVAVNLARRNLLLNRIEAHQFEVRKGNLLQGIEERYDLVIVNILPGVIVNLLDDIRTVLGEAGVFICSGMLEGNTHRVLNKMRAVGLEVVETLGQGRWVSIAGKLKSL